MNSQSKEYPSRNIIINEEGDMVPQKPTGSAAEGIIMTILFMLIIGMVLVAFK